MTIEHFLMEDVEAASGDIMRFRKELFDESSDFLDLKSELCKPGKSCEFSDDLQEFSNRVYQLLDRLDIRLDAIGSEDFDVPSEGEGVAFSLLMLANELNVQFEWLTNILEEIEQKGKAEQNNSTTSTKWQVLKNRLTTLLKRFLLKIWQIVSNLLTPKEWKLMGKVGTGLLGLDDAGIEITFGK